jgi:hypothetical protein
VPPVFGQTEYLRALAPSVQITSDPRTLHVTWQGRRAVAASRPDDFELTAVARVPRERTAPDRS